MNNPISQGISFEEFKKALGETADKYSDAHIDELWRLCDHLADIVFTDWLNKVNTV